MNYIKLIIFSLVAFGINNYSRSQSLESILESHFKIVGLEKLLTVETIVMKGKLHQGGLLIEIITFNQRPLKYRLEGRYEGFTFVEVFDGKIGWTFNQILGDEQPNPMADNELELLKLQADFDGLLYNYGEKGFSIELLEPQSVGNVLTDVIQLKKDDDLKITYYLDSESGVILRSTTEANIFGVKRVYDSIFREYRYVDQILFPFIVDVYMNGELIMEFEYTTIELNAEIEDFRFATPQALQESTESY